MSKQCKFCNAEMADDAVQCPECEKFIPGYESIKRKKKEKSKSTKKTVIIVSIFAAVVIILVLVINAIVNVIIKNSEEADSDYAKVFDKYIEATLNSDYDEYLEVFPDFYAKEIDNMFSYICPESSEYLEMLKETMVRQYGNINEITYEINSEGVANEDKLESYREEWVNVYGCPEDAKISAVYIIDADFTVSGKKCADEINQNVMLAKIDGKWYLMNLMYLFDTEALETTAAE